MDILLNRGSSKSNLLRFVLKIFVEQKIACFLFVGVNAISGLLAFLTLVSYHHLRTKAKFQNVRVILQ